MRSGGIFRAAILALLAPLTSGLTCGEGPQASAETPPLPASIEDIMAYSRSLLEKQGFPVESFLPEKGFLSTGWKTQLSPRYQEGLRERVQIYLWEKEGATVAAVDAQREINDNYRSPLREADADWIRSGNNRALQDRLVLLLKMEFDPQWKKN